MTIGAAWSFKRGDRGIVSGAKVRSLVRVDQLRGDPETWCL